MLALFSLLADPDVDGVTKFCMEHFPYVSGTRMLLDESWYAVYHLVEHGIHISVMRTRTDFEGLARIIEAGQY